jgi:cell shape-determining protein MreC
VASVAVAVFVFLHYAGAGMLGGIAHTVAKPFWYIEQGVQSAALTVSSYFTSHAQLTRENEQLRAEIERARARLADHSQVVAELYRLRKQVGRTNEDTKVIQAFILKRPGATPYDTLVVDVGSTKGVKIGKKVYVDVGVPLGTVATVYDSTAVIRLISSPGDELDVYVADEKTNEMTAFVAKGRGLGTYELSVPIDFPVELGTPVSLPGPGAQVIGTVRSIEEHDSKSFRTLFVGSALNLNRLTDVFIEL